MQITINVKDSEIKAAIENVVENEIYDQYDSDVLKKAKVPSKAALVKELMADPAVPKAVTKIVEDIEVIEYLYDNLYDHNFKRLSDLGAACEQALNELEAATEDERKAAEEKRKVVEEEAIIQRTIKALERQGYKIVKA